MSEKVDLYNSTYGNFKEQVLAELRHEKGLSRFVFVAEK